MRLSIKIAFVVFIFLFIFLTFTNIGSSIYASLRPSTTTYTKLILPGSGLTEVQQHLTSSPRPKEIHRLFVPALNSSSERGNGTGVSRDLTEQGGGEIVRNGSLLLDSSAAGNVTLFVATIPSKREAKLPDCPDQPPHLVGNVAPITEPQTVARLEELFPFMGPGGNYQPPDCKPRQRVAILIPYRNRWEHLHALLRNLIPFLVRQQTSFTIFVIDQEPPSLFNRGLLLNIGILEASLVDNYDCFFLHDVDLIPLTDHNLYRCSSQPKHFAVALNKFKYRVVFPNYFGGVSALTRKQIEQINGNSNLFFGWGGEDDDLLHRLQARGMKIVRDPLQISRYDMFKHTRDHGNEANPIRFKLLKTTKTRMDRDGLNSLIYNVTSFALKPLYTWIKVKVDSQQYR